MFMEFKKTFYDEGELEYFEGVLELNVNEWNIYHYVRQLNSIMFQVCLMHVNVSLDAVQSIVIACKLKHMITKCLSKCHVQACSTQTAPTAKQR